MVPVPKPRKTILSDINQHIAERSQRRAQAKREEEAQRQAEKKRKLEEKRLREEMAASKGGNRLSNSMKQREDKESKEESPVSVKCFGEEISPDFDVGKKVEESVTDLPCIWDEEITYELQVRRSYH